MDAAALVVGIDAYDNHTALSGCVPDALETTAWLRSVGVPAGRIRLHLAPLKRLDPAPPEGVILRGASRDEIWKSITEIAKEAGERLFVFLSGHGYYLAETGPVFLCRDWGEAFSDKNLDVLEYAEYFRSLDYRDQLFVVDACQNLDVPEMYRSGIAPGRPGVAGYTPKPDVGLLLCCAADQGQYAPIVGGRGLLTRAILAALNTDPEQLPPTVKRPCVYDWRTGVAKLDFCPMFEDLISLQVRDEAAKGDHTQTPTRAMLGRYRNEWNCFVRDVPMPPPRPLKITAGPLEGLEHIKVRLRSRVQELELLPSSDFLPFDGVAPYSRSIVANCEPNDGWTAEPIRVPAPAASPQLVPDAGLELHFKLTKLGPDGRLDHFNLESIAPDGRVIGALSPSDYKAAGIDYDAGPAKRGEAFHVSHETGPDIVPNGATSEVVWDLARDLSAKLTPVLRGRHPAAEYVFTPPGRDRRRQRPRLRIELPAGGSDAFCGVLANERLIRIEQLDAPHAAPPVKELRPARLDDRSWVSVPPGGYRIVAELPWGSVAVAVEIEDEPQTVQLTHPAGARPLRHRADKPYFTPGLERYFRRRGSVESPIVPVLGSLELLIGEVGGRVRMEPFSTVPWVEWDLLVGLGRLTVVDLDRAAKRLGEAPEAPDLVVFAWAIGYASLAQGRRDILERVLHSLPRWALDQPDTQLLRAVLTDEVVRDLRGLPCLRWGTELIAKRAPGLALPGTVSPVSTWTIYEPTTEKAPEPQRRAMVGLA